MTKKKEKEVSMELTYYEIPELNEIQNSREALGELQRALIPFAEGISRRQRAWWDRVLEIRGLTREDTHYVIKDGRTIVNELIKEN